MDIEIIKENNGLYTLLFDGIWINDLVETTDDIMERFKNDILLYTQIIKRNYKENGLWTKPKHYTTFYKESVPNLDFYIKQLKIEKKQNDIVRDFI